MIPIHLLGAGGHCRSCIDVIEAEGRYVIRGIVVKQGSDSAGVMGYGVAGTDEELSVLLREVPDALVTVGQIKSPDARIALYRAVKSAGGRLPFIVSPGAVVSRHAAIGEGTIVMHGAVVNACSTIGVNSIINSLALVEHDAVVGDHCHISTGVRLNGGVVVGEGTFIGSGSVVREGVTIGDGCLIAMGSIIDRDLPSGTRFIRPNR
jgi:sugar O-acyltransferase (sialic acid O-acetyltransferase NeuD family)